MITTRMTTTTTKTRTTTLGEQSARLQLQGLTVGCSRLSTAQLLNPPYGMAE